MPVLHLAARGAPTTMTPAVFNLLIALVVIFFLATVLTVSILVLRLKRAQRSTSACSRSHRRLTIEAVGHSAMLSEKDALMASPPASPPLTLPEIRITFPDDEGDKSAAGRVVVVRVGDNAAVGLGPVDEDQLPPYQAAEGERFQSLDLERIGGLKEKTEKRY
jgi:hypothetical protein